MNDRDAKGKYHSGFVICPACSYIIDTSTDDNFNSEHSKVKCPHCEWWWSCATLGC